MRPGTCLPLAVLSVLTTFQAPAAAAATEEEELALAYGDKSTVSIATGSKRPLRRAPAVATVITAEDIAAMGAVDLDDVLETVPGLHVSRNNGLYTPLYFIRGIGSPPVVPQVLLLQNGIPMTTVYTGDKGVMWGGYPIEHIARIEVIRGPGSALYGADAYSGVINIITKTAEDTRGSQLGARGASFHTWDTWIQHGGQLGSVDVAAYLRAGHTDGFSETITEDNQTRLDRLFGTNASLAPGPVNTGRDAVDANLDLSYQKWRWRYGYKLRDDMGTYAGISAALDPNSIARSERVTTDLSWTDPQLARDWGGGVLVSYLYYTEKAPNGLTLFPAGATFPSGSFPDGVIGGPDRWERQYRVSAFVTYGGFLDHRWRVGLGHDDLDLFKATTYKNFLLSPAGAPIPTGPVTDYSEIQPHIRPQRRENNYVYVQDEWQIAPDWELTAGVRHDRYSDFGDTTNPRLALVWAAAFNVTAKLLYGEAFRAPSFNDQYGINPVANGNLDLRPETIKTSEAALAWQARPDTQVNLSVFYYRMKDIIRAVPNVGAPGATLNNAGDQHGLGMEFETVWDASRHLRLSGNYARQRAVDAATDLDAGFAPHNHIYGRADWRFAGGWLLSGQVNWVADRQRDRRDVNRDGIADDTRPDIDDYTTVDVTLQTHTKRNQWHLMFAVRNLFDADAREPSLGPAPGQTPAIPNDLPLPGRWYLLQARYQL